MRNVNRIALILLALDVFFVILHLLFGERFDLFHLDRERTFAAYYSGAKLVAIASLAVCGALLSRARLMRCGWIAVALLFLGLGFDEISELHENITYYMLAYGVGIMNEISFFRTPTYNWLVLLAPLIVVSFIFLVVFSRTLRTDHRESYRWFCASLMLFAAALGLELVGGLFAPVDGLFKVFVLEEFVEMVAATVMVRALLVFVSNAFLVRYTKAL